MTPSGTPRPAVVGLLALLLAPLLPVAVALACSFAPPPVITSGLLGLMEYTYVEDAVVPRNAAVLGDTLSLADGTPVAVSPVPGGVPGLAQVDQLLPVGAVVQGGTNMATVEDVVDMEPPGAPVVVGGAFQASEGSSGGCSRVESSCGDIQTIHVDLTPAADDLTPASRMSYALYMASSEAGLDDPASFDGVYVLEPGGDLWRFAERSEGADDIWVSVAAIDLAGHVGPRSAAVQIHADPSDGCAVGAPGDGPGALIAVGLILGLLHVRRRRSLLRS